MVEPSFGRWREFSLDVHASFLPSFPPHPLRAHSFWPWLNDNGIEKKMKERERRLFVTLYWTKKKNKKKKNQKRKMKNPNPMDQMHFHSTCFCLVYGALRWCSCLNPPKTPNLHWDRSDQRFLLSPDRMDIRIETRKANGNALWRGSSILMQLVKPPVLYLHSNRCPIDPGHVL